MSRSAQTSKRPGFVRRLAHWWRSWKITRATLHPVDCYAVTEVERIARGLGAGVPELHTWAGKWPDAVAPLNRRLAALDAAHIRHSEPRVSP
jgi:hypothetical protein